MQELKFILIMPRMGGGIQLLNYNSDNIDSFAGIRPPSHITAKQIQSIYFLSKGDRSRYVRSTGQDSKAGLHKQVRRDVTKC